MGKTLHREENAMTSINGVPVPMPGRYSGKQFKNIPKYYTGPDDIRDILIDKFTVEWVASYIDQCDWIDSSRTLIANHSFAYAQMMSQASGILGKLEIKLEDPKSKNGEPRHPFSPKDDFQPRGRPRPDVW